MSDTKFDVTLKGNKVLPEKKIIQETPHRKKKNQKSKSSQRSDHKHEYQGVILESFIGWKWGEYCIVCGRIQENGLCFGDKEFLKPEYRDSRPTGRYKYLSLEEIREKYKGVPVFVLNRESHEYERVE